MGWILGLETGMAGWMGTGSEGRSEGEKVLQLDVLFSSAVILVGFLSWCEFVRLSMVR